MSKKNNYGLKIKVVWEALKKIENEIFFMKGVGVAESLAGCAYGAKQTKTCNESSLMYHTVAGRRESD